MYFTRVQGDDNMIDNISYLHRSTAEKEAIRERLERSFTHLPLEANDLVKSDEYALQLFNKIGSLFAMIGRDDALFSESLNRYCLKSSELRNITLQLNKIQDLLDSEEDVKQYNKLLKSYNDLTKTSNTISQLLLALERELSLTPNSLARCKLPIQTKESDGMEDLFN